MFIGEGGAAKKFFYGKHRGSGDRVNNELKIMIEFEEAVSHVMALVVHEKEKSDGEA